MRLLDKILDYLISKKERRLTQLKMQNTQDNFRLAMLQRETPKRQQR